MTDANPCPFCGAIIDPLGFGQTGYGVGRPWWHVSCYTCHASGPVAETVERAIELWNRVTDANATRELEHCKQLLRNLGRFCGCDHVESADDREQQVRHIEQAFEALQDENRRLRSLLANPCWQIVA